jgi:GH15 family glucan-1,4-alpha-glucosidase
MTRRRYLPGTAVLETRFETAEGVITITDFMPLGVDEEMVELTRLVRGVAGEVPVEMEFVLRFGYGRAIPWVRRRDYGLRAVAGPDAIDLVTPAKLHGENLTTRSNFTVKQGEAVPFTLAYHPSNRDPHFIDDRELVLERTTGWWRDWSGRCRLPADAPPTWSEAIIRSLITLKAMTFQPTGAIIAAPTTSLPEEIGGERNWDYRYCWIRDATLTLYSLLNAGYFEEAKSFREWLLRAAAGHPEQMQIMYGVAGERRLTEIELPWLHGYENSRPVRIGNKAHSQLQLDVYGELMDAFYAARRSQLAADEAAWRLELVLLKNLEGIWREPDKGIWEVRSQPRQFTFSKMMAWVAFDRGIKMVEQFGLEGPSDHWRQIREDIRADVLANGFDEERNSFVQSYGGKGVDAALLQAAALGFLEPKDPRFRGTVECIERELLEGGFVRRYRPFHANDGLHGSEGTFLACSFWLADAYVLLDRYEDAAELFERLLSLRNDLGLLAEEYDSKRGRFLGNFPQAYSHVGLINTAHNLLKSAGPSAQRASHDELPQADMAEKGGCE